MNQTGCEEAGRGREDGKRPLAISGNIKMSTDRRASNIHTLSPAEESKDALPCDRCRSNQELITALQEALTEVADQNAVLRERTVELEACISLAEDQLVYKQSLMRGLQKKQRDCN